MSLLWIYVVLFAVTVGVFGYLVHGQRTAPVVADVVATVDER